MNKHLGLAVASISLILIISVNIPFIRAQPTGNIIINSDGSISGTQSIQRTGSIYILTNNISETIQVQKSNIVLDGKGFTVNVQNSIGIDLSNGIGQNPSRPTISNVTIQNFRIVNCNFGVQTNGGGYNTFYSNYITNCSNAINLAGGCSNNSISYCTLSGDETTIGIVYSSNYNMITENNIFGAVIVWLSEFETIDKNYWNPGNSFQDQDSHPLANPVLIPMEASPLSSPSPSLSSSPTPNPSVPEFSWLTILPILLAIPIALAIVERDYKESLTLKDRLRTWINAVFF
jgi:hypothetical protein